MTDVSVLVERVLKGENPTEVLNSIQQRRQSPLPPKQNTCPLAYLRPNDRFRFYILQNLVHFDIDESAPECVVMPAARGFVTFAYGDKTFTINLEEAIHYSVVLLSDTTSVSERRFYDGDKVKSRVNNKIGKIIEKASKEEYLVLFDNEAEPHCINGKALALIDKDQTTRSYLRQEGEEWVVEYGRHISNHKTMLDACKKLYSASRPAFNRYSKLASTDTSIPLDTRTIKYLLRVDPKIWRNKQALIGRGLMTDDQDLNTAVLDLTKESDG